MRVWRSYGDGASTNWAEELINIDERTHEPVGHALIRLEPGADDGIRARLFRDGVLVATLELGSPRHWRFGAMAIAERELAARGLG